MPISIKKKEKDPGKGGEVKELFKPSAIVVRAPQVLGERNKVLGLKIYGRGGKSKEDECLSETQKRQKRHKRSIEYVRKNPPNRGWKKEGKRGAISQSMDQGREKRRKTSDELSCRQGKRKKGTEERWCTQGERKKAQQVLPR